MRRKVEAWPSILSTWKVPPVPRGHQKNESKAAGRKRKLFDSLPHGAGGLGTCFETGNMAQALGAQPLPHRPRSAKAI